VLRSLALAVVRGEPFFGRDTSAGTVVYLALEDKATQIVSSFIGLGALDDPVYIHLGSAYNCMRDLRHSIIALCPKLVIIDPIFEC
jgi:RecA-family ATPase